MRASLREMAQELLRLYAERQVVGGARDRPRHALAARVRGGVPVRGDAGPAGGDPPGQGRPRAAPADGPARLRRRGLRQDRGRDARGPQGRPRRAPGGRPRAHDDPRRAALEHVPRALRALPGAGRDALPLPVADAAEGRPGRAGGGDRGRRHRHPPAALQGRRLQGPRPPRRGRGAPVRRGAQGAAQAAPEDRPRAHADGDAHPADAVDGDGGHPRPVGDRDAAGRPARGRDGRLPVRRPA